MIQQAQNALGKGPRLHRLQIFDLLQRQQSGSGFANAVTQMELRLGLPREAIFYFLNHRNDRLRQIPFKKVADKNRMDHNLAFRTLLGGRTGHERWSFHEVHEAVVAAGDDALGKNEQRVLGIRENLDGASQ